MLYHLFRYLDEQFDFIGAGVFNYISFRALAAACFSLLIVAVFGRRMIDWLRRQQIGESIRDLGLEGQMEKKGTPTMGGIIIIAGIVLPVLLFSRIENVYILLLLLSTVWMGLIGFLDDYIKVFRKNKEGLHGRFKIIGQICLGVLVGSVLYFNQNVKVREYSVPVNRDNVTEVAEQGQYQDVKSLTTTIPFFKSNEFDYAELLPTALKDYAWVLYIVIVTFIITAVSNGANITDGIDGLAAGTTAIIAVALSILAYVSGNIIFAEYLNIMYLPNTGEVVIFCMALVGACIGFLWYNAYPAQVFMGDTGSLALGASVAVLAIAIRKELLIPVLCGVFLIENLSVIIQVSYFKYTKKKYGEGRRIFKMSPLHHHYQKSNIHEAKIVTRFWIVGILLAIVTLATLKIR